MTCPKCQSLSIKAFRINVSPLHNQLSGIILNIAGFGIYLVTQHMSESYHCTKFKRPILICIGGRSAGQEPGGVLTDTVPAVTTL